MRAKNMKSKIIKLKFQTSVHFGDGDLERCNAVFYADALFSALFIEALKIGTLEQANRIKDRFSDGRMQISDLFPYIGNRLYLPKPRVRVSPKEQNGANDTLEKKAYKKLKYIPMDRFDQCLDGTLRAQEEWKLFRNHFGSSFLVEKMSKYNLLEDEINKLYAVRIFGYKKESGLYFVFRYEEEEDWNEFQTLMQSLSYSGIGGERSLGYGRFDLQFEEIPKELDVRLNHSSSNTPWRSERSEYMSLSIALPKDEEMEGILDGARYELVKRSGFVASTTYATSFQRKKDLFMFSSGSIFAKCFQGDIFDVSDKKGHEVYRYGKPMFLAL